MEYIDELKKLVGEEKIIEVLKIVQKVMNTSFEAGRIEAKREFKKEFDKIWNLQAIRKWIKK